MAYANLMNKKESTCTSLGMHNFGVNILSPTYLCTFPSRLREDCILFLVLLVSLIDTCTLMRQFLTFYHPDLFVTSAWVDGNYSFFSFWLPTLTVMEIFVALMYLGTEGQKRSCLFQFFLRKCFIYVLEIQAFTEWCFYLNCWIW